VSVVQPACTRQRASNRISRHKPTIKEGMYSCLRPNDARQTASLGGPRNVSYSIHITLLHSNTSTVSHVCNMALNARSQCQNFSFYVQHNRNVLASDQLSLNLNNNFSRILCTQLPGVGAYTLHCSNKSQMSQMMLCVTLTML